MTNVWSCGGGTQSAAIATLIKQGRLPKPDFAFMTDTGREKSYTWPFVNGYIRPALDAVGIELEIVPASNFARLDLQIGENILLPGYTNQSGQLGKLSPFCSGKWKRDVAERWMRSKGIERARNWIGISRDEARRIRAQHRQWLQLWYPLIFEVPMTRKQCVTLIRNQGWTGEIPHSGEEDRPPGEVQRQGRRRKAVDRPADPGGVEALAEKRRRANLSRRTRSGGAGGPRGGGRPRKPTPCARCGVLCPSAREAWKHQCATAKDAAGTAVLARCAS